MMKKKKLSKVDNIVIKTFKKLLNNKKLMNEMALNTKAFMKLNIREQKSMLRFHDRIKDNTRWETLVEAFCGIYDILKKKKQTKEVKEFMIEVNSLEKQIRKKYGYWKGKNKK